MMDQPTEPYSKLLESVSKNSLPEPVQKAVENGLSTTCEAAVQSLAFAKDSAETATKATPMASDATLALTAKVFELAVENTEAAFAAARAIVRAKSPTEAIKLQVEYTQAQFAKAGKQAKELFELSAKVGEKQVAGFRASAADALGQFKG